MKFLRKQKSVKFSKEKNIKTSYFILLLLYYFPTSILIFVNVVVVLYPYCLEEKTYKHLWIPNDGMNLILLMYN